MAAPTVDSVDGHARLSLPLIGSKLTLEPPRAFLPRQRLMDMLGDGPRPNVILVCAPAGSGKSTLLYQLVSRADPPVVYYRLGHTDRDIPQFVSYLTAGIGRHEPGFGARVKSYLVEIRERPDLWKNVGDIFVHELGQFENRRLWIVLDDYQDLADSADVAGLVKQLVECLPSGVRLVLSSRGVPPLPTSRWKVQGDLMEIGPSDLAFTWDETQQYFQRVAGVVCQEDQLRSIHAATEGWIAGLVLASQIAKSRSPEDAVMVMHGFADTESPIHDYLAEQVYATQPAAMREFLRRTSILSQLSPDLCDELLGSKGSGRVLERLHRAGLFLLSVGAGDRLYRYHQLFREFLRAKFQEEETPGVIKQIRMIAGRLLETRQQWDEAILHYSLGGDIASASDLVKRFGEQAIEGGHVQRVARWLNELPEKAVRSEPALLMLRGLIAMRMGDTRLALRLYERCQALLAKRPDPQVEMALAFHVGVVHFRQGSYAQSMAVLEKSFQQDAGAQPTRIELQRLLGVAYRGAGELAKAEQQALQVLQQLDTYPHILPRGSVTRAATLRNMAQVKRFAGELDAALEYSREAVLLCETEDAGEFQEVRALAILGATHSLRGDFREAIKVLEQARSKGANFSPPERQLVAGLLANVYRDLDDLSLAEAFYRQGGSQFISEFSFLCLRQGQVREALNMAQDAMRLRGSQELPFEGACAQVAYALGLEALGLVEMADENLRIAADLLMNRGYGQRYASVCLRLSRLWAARGDPDRSELWLARWLGEARRLQLCHFNWWDPELFVSALDQALRQRIDVEYATQLALRRLPTDRLQSLFPRAEGSPGPNPSPTARRNRPSISVRQEVSTGDVETLLSSCQDPQSRAVLSRELKARRITPDLVRRLREEFRLTWKEMLIFVSYHLRAGYRAAETEFGLRSRVAAELCISENTLKTHIASLRRKLKLPHRIGTVGLLAWGAELGVLHLFEELSTSENHTAG